jgi:hypothetical protein
MRNLIDLIDLIETPQLDEESMLNAAQINKRFEMFIAHIRAGKPFYLVDGTPVVANPDEADRLEQLRDDGKFNGKISIEDTEGEIWNTAQFLKTRDFGGQAVPPGQGVQSIKTNGGSATYSVSKKEFSPTVMGLAGKVYNRDELISAAQAAVVTKTRDRPTLQAILLELIEVAQGLKQTLSPENLANFDSDSKNKISQDFGEVLAPIMLAKENEDIEFPAAGNFPLIDVVVGANKYSVKSLTGSGTSFSSIVKLLDSFEQQIATDEDQKALYELIKQYKPGDDTGLNVDKIIRAGAHAKIPEHEMAVQVFGQTFNDYTSLTSLVSGVTDNSTDNYAKMLRAVYPISVAGNWGGPIGLPADANKYVPEIQIPLRKGEAKQAGYPAFKQNPVKATADILTYIVGAGTLNYVTQGEHAKEYSEMMTKIVNQSPAWLGHITITRTGGLDIVAEPFSELNFKFQYHAPSHKPGNNLPGFMVVMPKKGDKDKKKSKSDIEPGAGVTDAPPEPAMKLKDPGTSMGADKISRPGRKPETRSAPKGLGRERR